MTRWPTGKDGREANAVGRLVGPDGLRDRAALVLRCDDCGGYLVGCVTYVHGRPLWASRGFGGRKPVEHHGWGFSWLDLGAHARTRCRAQAHVWTCAELLAELPASGAAQVEHRVSHQG